MRERWEAIVDAGGVTVVVVPYPVDLEIFHIFTPHERTEARQRFGLSDETAVLGFVGRIEPDKGVHVLAAAAQRLVRSVAAGRPVHVLLQGVHNPRIAVERAQTYRRKCEALFDETPHTWVPASPDTAGLLAAADVIAVPSVWQEPSGLAVTEALASGLPLVASAVGGIPEQVPDSRLIRLVPSEDEEALCAALSDLITATPTVAERNLLRDHVIRTRAPDQIIRSYLAALTLEP